jgi:hypothetical protein
MKNAPEFWLLAKIVWERLEAERSEEYVTDSLWSRNGGDVPSLGFPVLEKYDETSMGQVNDIITMFSADECVMGDECSKLGSIMGTCLRVFDCFGSHQIWQPKSSMILMFRDEILF